MKIYLAVPYTGREEEGFKEANKKAGELMSQGHMVFSPISHTHPIAIACNLPKEYEYWEHYDRTFIKWCDELHVICLKNWVNSKGVIAEIAIAQDMNKKVVLLTITENVH